VVGEEVHGLDRVGEDGDVGVGGPAADAGDGGGFGDLVGDEEARHAEVAGDAGLEGVGDGDADGSGVELATPQLRGHRGLAVRREGEPALGAPGGHGRRVVVESPREERERRSLQVVFDRNGRDPFGEGHAVRGFGDRLVAPVEDVVVEGLESALVHAHRH
jgi:hypothetical protein